MNATTRKVLGDLRERPGRTALVAVATALGTSTVIAALSAGSVLTREIDGSFLRARPPHLVFVVSAATYEQQQRLLANEGVAAVSRRQLVRGRIRAGHGPWHALLLSVVPTFDDLSVSTVTSPHGRLAAGGFFIEQSSVRLLPLATGSRVELRLPDRQSVSTIVTDVVHDGGVAPGWQDRVVYGYADAEALQGWGALPTYDELRVLVQPGRDVAQLASDLTRALSEIDTALLRVEMPVRAHPHAEQMATVLVLIGAFATLGLVISATLMATMMLGMLRAQIRQVGILKAIGATPRRVLGMFVATGAAIAVPAALVGIGPGWWAARAFVTFAAAELNLDGLDLLPRVWPIAVGAGAGIAVPLATAWLVCRRVLTTTVVDALRGERPTASATPTSTWIPTAGLAYALRNVTRQRGRAAMTAVALTLGGASLMTAAHVYRSLVAAVDRSFSFRLDDVDLRLARPVNADDLAGALTLVPGVRHMETWGGGLATFARPNGTSSSRYGLLSPPLDTRLLHLPVAQGRWLGEGPHPEIVVTANLLARESVLALGREAPIAFLGQQVRATLVGVVEEVSEPAIYVNPSGYRALTGDRALVGVVRLQLGDPRLTATSALDDALFDAGMTPAFVFDRASLRQSTSDHFVILLVVLGTMATAALVVGGLGLATSTSITMAERRREVGILKSVGAGHGTVMRLCLVEASVVVTAAVAAAMVGALGLSWGLEQVVGRHALHVAIPYRLSSLGIAVWICVAPLIGLLATVIPVRASLRQPIRNALVVE